MVKKAVTTTESVRDRLRRAAHDSGMTLEEMGTRMGYAKSGARQAVSRLLNQESAAGQKAKTGQKGSCLILSVANSASPFPSRRRTSRRRRALQDSAEAADAFHFIRFMRFTKRIVGGRPPV